MDLVVPVADLEDLLKCFLIGTQNVPLASRIRGLAELPPECRDRVRAAQALGRGTAWSTERGPMVAWGTYDGDGSRRLMTHLLYIEWFVPPGEYHAAWWRCDPNRPMDWTLGRGSLGEAH
jgi:hypothetical protein